MLKNTILKDYIYSKENHIKKFFLVFFYGIFQSLNPFLVKNIFDENLKKLIFIKNILFFLSVFYFFFKKKFERYKFNFLENLFITYFFSFFSFSVCILKNFRIENLLLIFVSFSFLFLIFDYKLFLIHTILGLIFSNLFFNKCINIDFYEILNCNLFSIYFIFYQFLIFVILGFYFTKVRNDFLNELNFEKKFYIFLQNQYKKDLFFYQNSEEKIFKNFIEKNEYIFSNIESLIKNLKIKSLEEIEKKLIEISQYLINFSKKTEEYIRLNPENINFENLSNDIKNIFFQKNEKNNIFLKSKHKSIFVDKNSLFRILSQLFLDWNNEFKSLKDYKKNLNVYITDSKIFYSTPNSHFYRKVESINIILTFSDLNKKILQIEHFKSLMNPEKFYSYSLKEFTKKNNEKLIEANYGLFFKNFFDDELVLGFSIPINIYDIRPKNLDINNLSEKNISDLIKIEENEKRIEKKLLENYENFDIKKLNTAFSIIKKYYKIENIQDIIEVSDIFLKLINIKDDIKDFIKEKINFFFISSLFHNLFKKTSYHFYDLMYKFDSETVRIVIRLNEILNKENVFFNLEKDEIFFDFEVFEDKIIFLIKTSEYVQKLIHIDSFSQEEQNIIVLNILDFFVYKLSYIKFFSLSKELKNACIYFLEKKSIRGYNFEIINGKQI